MKIVVLDGAVENPGDLSWEELGKLGELTVYERTSMTDEAEIAQRIGGASVVITNKTPITRGVLERCPSVRYISVLATGYNVVDCAVAREKGIPVSNVPAYGTDVVGQFAIALLLEICHHIGHHNQAVQEGSICVLRLPGAKQMQSVQIILHSSKVVIPQMEGLMQAMREVLHKEVAESLPS